MTDESQQNSPTESPENITDQEVSSAPENEPTKILAKLKKTDKMVLAAYALVALSVLTIAALVVFKIYIPTNKKDTTQTDIEIQAHENPVKFIENHIQQLLGLPYEIDRQLGESIASGGTVSRPELDDDTVTKMLLARAVEEQLPTYYELIFKDTDTGYYVMIPSDTGADVFGTSVGIDHDDSNNSYGYRPTLGEEFVSNGLDIRFFERDIEIGGNTWPEHEINIRAMMKYINKLLLDNGFEIYTADGYAESVEQRTKDSPPSGSLDPRVRYVSQGFYCDLGKGLNFSDNNVLTFGCATKQQVQTAIENTKELYGVIVKGYKLGTFGEEDDSFKGIIGFYSDIGISALYGYEILTLGMAPMDDNDWGVPTTTGGYMIWLYRKQASEDWTFGFAGGHYIEDCAEFTEVDGLKTLNDDGLRAFYEKGCLDDSADGLTINDRATTIGEYYGLTPDTE